MNLASPDGASPWLPRYFLPVVCCCFLLGSLPIEAVAKVKAIYKLLVTDYRGNRWIDYTAVDASTYVTYNGGTTFIKDVQVLAHWKVKSEGSLYGKSLTNMKAWKAKRPELQVVPNPSTVSASKAVPVSNSVQMSQQLAPAVALRNRQRLALAKLASHQQAKEFSKFADARNVKVSDLLTPEKREKIKLAQAIPGMIESTPKNKPLLTKGKRITAINKVDKKASQKVNLVTLPAKPKPKPEPRRSPQQLNSTVLRRVNRYKNLIQSAAKHHNVDPELLSALVYVESGGNYQAVSPKKARGLTQLTAATAKELGVTDVFDPRQNIFGGAEYLGKQLKSFGKESLALAAYNAGPTRVRTRQKLPSETRRYIQKVLQVKSELEAQ
jgi:soluble lytic murein transglycosylase-like protein